MADNLITNYNPYASYYNNWMSYPYNMNNMFMPFYGTNNMFQDSLYSNQLFNVPANKADIPAASSSASDAVAFTSNSISKDDKKGSYTGAIIGTGITLAAIAGGLYYLYRRGGGGSKGVKQAIKDGWNDLFKKAPKEPPKNPPVGTEAGSKTKKAKEANQSKKVDIATEISNHSKEPAKKYTSLETAIADYKQRLQSGEFSNTEDANELLNKLIPHNYHNDKSFIEVHTRTSKHDYLGRTLDLEKGELYQYEFTADLPEMARPDVQGSYLIKTLSDGRRFVGLSFLTGRVDCTGTPIRASIDILSKNNEFTPLQKDLIEIISQRKNIDLAANKTDILSLGLIPYVKDKNKIIPYEVNTELLLSSIKTAKSQLPESIDKEFINKALNGETFERVTMW